MNLNEIRATRKSWLEWKNIAPLVETINSLKDVQNISYTCSDIFTLSSSGHTCTPQIEKVARELKPWRKGPFDIFGLFIDTEWRSFIK